MRSVCRSFSASGFNLTAGKIPRSVFTVILLAAALAGSSRPVSAQATTVEDYLERAREHYERRRFLNALDSLRVVLDMTAENDARTDRNKFEAEILAANALKSLGRLEEAANMYERALAHGYREKSVHSFLALYQDKHSRWNAALEQYEKYYAIDKSDVPVHIRYAALLGRLKRREDAKKILENTEPKLVSQKSEDCEKLEQQKKIREAHACFRAVRESKPDREQNYLGAYRTALALKDKAQIQENAEWLYFIFGSEPRYIWPLIEFKLAQKKFYDARRLLEEIIRISGQDSDAERLLANLRVQAGSALDKPFKATKKEMHMLNDVLESELDKAR